MPGSNGTLISTLKYSLAGIDDELLEELLDELLLEEELELLLLLELEEDDLSSLELVEGSDVEIELSLDGSTEDDG